MNDSLLIADEDVMINTLVESDMVNMILLEHVPTGLQVEGVGKSKQKLYDKLMNELDQKVRESICE